MKPVVKFRGDVGTVYCENPTEALLAANCYALVVSPPPYCVSLSTPTEETEAFDSKEMEDACDCKSSADTQHAGTTASLQFSLSLLLQEKRAARSERLTDECPTIDDEDSKTTAEWSATASTAVSTTAVCDSAKVHSSYEKATSSTLFSRAMVKAYEQRKTAGPKKHSRICAMLKVPKRKLSKYKRECRQQWRFWRFGERRYDWNLGFEFDRMDFASSKYRSLLADDCIPGSIQRVAVLRGKLPFRTGLYWANYVTELTLLFDICYKSPIRSLFAESRFGIRRGPQEIVFQAATDKPVLLLDIDHCILDNQMKADSSHAEDSDEHKPLEIDRALDADGVCDGCDLRLRPGLIEFLREVRRRYRVVLFTAACASYHEIFAVLRKHFRKDGADVDLIFTREQSVTFWRRDGDSDITKPHMRKDPTRLGFSPQFGVVLDDSFQPWNGEWAANTLLIPPYTGKGPADDCLKEAAEILRRVATHPLSAEGDIRYALHGINAEDIDEAEKHLGRALSRKRATDRIGALQATRDVCLMLALKSGLDSAYLRVFEELLMDDTATDPVICSYLAEYWYKYYSTLAED